MAITHHLSAGGSQRELFSLNGKIALERSFFPFLQITNQTKPGTMARQLEHQFIIGRIGRFQEKHLDEGSSLLAEVHTGLYHLRVVEHHQCTLWKIIGQMIEGIV